MIQWRCSSGSDGSVVADDNNDDDDDDDAAGLSVGLAEIKTRLNPQFI